MADFKGVVAGGQFVEVDLAPHSQVNPLVSLPFEDILVVDLIY